MTARRRETHDADLQAVLEGVSILDGEETLAANAAYLVDNERADGDIAIDGHGNLCCIMAMTTHMAGQAC